MKSCDKDDILHAVEATTKVLRNLEADVNVLEYPFAEITASHSVLTFCLERKIQQSTLPSRA